MMSALYGFFKGYNEMGDALANERIKRTQASMLEGELGDTQRRRELLNAAFQYEPEADAGGDAGDAAGAPLAGQGVLPMQPAPVAVQGQQPMPVAPQASAGTQPGAQAGLPLTAQGVMQQGAREVGAPEPAPQAQAGVSAPPAPAPATPAAPKPASKDVSTDPLSDRFRKAMDYLARNHAPDLALGVQQQWTQHLMNRLSAADSEFKLALMPQAQGQAKLELADRAINAASNMLDNAAKLDGLSRPLAVKALNLINQRMSEAGRPLWDTRQKAAGLQVSPDKAKLTVVDEQGQPVTADGKPLFFSTADWAKRAGLVNDRKFVTAKPGERVFGVTPGGGLSQVAEGGSPVTAATPAEKASDIRARVNDAAKDIDAIFGLTLGNDGQMMGSVRAGEEQRWADYKALAQRAIEAGAPSRTVVAVLNDQYLRDKAAGLKYSRARLPSMDALKRGPEQGAAPAARSQPSQPASQPAAGAGDPVAQLRQRFGF